ncbi:MAG: LOG family protein [Bdellovibrionales bacterium]
MKIFVPIFRDLIPPKHPEMFVNRMVEVSEDDLKNLVIPHWKKIDTTKDIYGVSRLYNMSIEEVCGHSVEYGTLDQYIRRPAFTVHAAALPGNESCAEQFDNLAYKTGFLAAKYGWNFCNGGGIAEKGGMGMSAKGFADGLKKNGRAEDQYSMQIVPSDLIVVDSKNGFRPPNEGLRLKSDVALVFPDFMMRLYILDSLCEAAASLCGSLGTLNEITDIAVSFKIGAKDKNFRFYILNPHVPLLKGKFFDPLKKQIENPIKCGIQDPKVRKHFRFMKTPEGIFKNLMTNLEKNESTPEQKYQARKEKYRFTPGVARPVPDVFKPPCSSQNNSPLI